MKQLKISCNIDVFEALDELPKDVQSLMNKAHNARSKAYAPYSKFLVGAALELSNGEIITGNNQENAAYPSGLCAERTAIFYAHAQFPEEAILRMAIAAGSEYKEAETPIPPCGGCRQKIAEFADPDVIVTLSNLAGDEEKFTVKDLLPGVFTKDHMD